MKHAPLVLLLVLASCGDSKPAPQPAKPQAPDVGVAATAVKPLTPDAPAPVPEASTPATPVADVPDPATAPVATSDEGTPQGEEHPAESNGEKASATAHKPEADKPKTSAKKHAESEAAPAAPPPITELAVQVLQEGSGRVVQRGDLVTLEYTISYVPKPSAEKKEDTKKGSKGSKKSDTKKTEAKKSEEKAEESKPKEQIQEGEKHAEEKSAAESHEPAAAKDDGQNDEKHAEPKATDPLKPIVVASTKSWTTPFSARLVTDGKPKLIPGLVRGVEGLKVGSRARILVPAALAYGKEGNASAGIPADTPVEIEVFVKDARE